MLQGPEPPDDRVEEPECAGGLGGTLRTSTRPQDTWPAAEAPPLRDRRVLSASPLGRLPGPPAASPPWGLHVRLGRPQQKSRERRLTFIHEQHRLGNSSTHTVTQKHSQEPGTAPGAGSSPGRLACSAVCVLTSTVCAHEGDRNVWVTVKICKALNQSSG